MGVIKSVKTVLRGNAAERERKAGGPESDQADDKATFAVQPDQAVTYALEAKPGGKQRVRTKTVPSKETTEENAADPLPDGHVPQDRRSLWVTFGFGRPTRVDLEEHEVDVDDLKKKLMNLYPRHLGHFEAFEFGLMLNSGSTELIPEDMPLSMLTLSNRAATPIYIDIPGDAQGAHVLPLSPVVNPGESSKAPPQREKRYSLSWGLQGPKPPQRRCESTDEDRPGGATPRRRSSFQFDVACVEDLNNKTEEPSAQVERTIGLPNPSDTRPMPMRTHLANAPATPTMFLQNPPTGVASHEPSQQHYVPPLPIHPVVHSNTPTNSWRTSPSGSQGHSPPTSPHDYDNDIPIPASVAQPGFLGPTTYPSLRSVHGMSGPQQENNPRQQGEMVHAKPGHTRESSFGRMLEKSDPQIPTDREVVISAPMKAGVYTHSLTPDAIYKILENSTAVESHSSRRSPAAHGNLNFVKPSPYQLSQQHPYAVEGAVRERRVRSLEIPRDAAHKQADVRPNQRRASIDAPTVKHVVDMPEAAQRRGGGRLQFWGKGTRQSNERGTEGGERSKSVITMWKRVFRKRPAHRDNAMSDVCPNSTFSDIQTPAESDTESPPVWTSRNQYRQVQR